MSTLRRWWPLLVSLAIAGCSLALWVPTRHLDRDTDSGPAALWAIVYLPAYVGIGALIVSRRPGHLVGWILVGIGFTWQIFQLGSLYAIYALVGAPGALPGGAWAGVVGESAPASALALTALLMLTFPTGRLLSRAWRLVGWLCAIAAVTISAGILLHPGTLQAVPSVQKPLQVDAARVTAWVWPVILVATFLAAASAVVRYRRSGPLERRQLRWFVASLPLAAAGVFIAPDDYALAAVTTLGAISPAGAIAVAILRERLYDLDVVIKRTAVYAVVSASLAGVYFGLVLALQQVFGIFTRGSDLAVAASTLAALALFRPARRRVQAFVDRRFHRGGYDPARALATFSHQLRDQVDLGQLEGGLARAVRETLEPAHVSLWVRAPEAPR